MSIAPISAVVIALPVPLRAVLLNVEASAFSRNTLSNFRPEVS